MHGDGDFPRVAHKRGYDSFEILVSHARPVGFNELGDTAGLHELCLLSHECMHGVSSNRHRRGSGASAPADDSGLTTGCVPLKLRTGWNATRSTGSRSSSWRPTSQTSAGMSAAAS